MEKKFFIIKAGDTFGDLIEEYGDFEDQIAAGLGQAPDFVRVVNAEKGETLPGPEEMLGAVISGAHAMVTQDLDWSLRLEQWTRKTILAGIPLLGICYGHQIMARAMGGTVDFHPKGTEIGTREIRCLGTADADSLFSGLPQRFQVHLYHSQSVIRLPEGAVLLAENGFEPHQAFRIGDCAWGVQFHPEACAAITRGYIRNLRAALESEGQDIDALTGTLAETPHAAALLKRFGDLACKGK